MWLKARPSSPAKRAPTAAASSCLRTSAARWLSTSSRAPRSARLTAPPTARRTCRSPRRTRSRRARRSPGGRGGRRSAPGWWAAWTPSPRARPPPRQRPPRCSIRPSSTSRRRRNSSTNSGLPSPAASTCSATAGSSSPPPSRFSISERVSEPLSGSSELSVVMLARRPEPQLEQLSAAHHEHEDRRVAAGGRRVLDEVEERRLGPVDVVEDQHDGPVGREPLLGQRMPKVSTGEEAASARPSTHPPMRCRIGSASSHPDQGSELLAHLLGRVLLGDPGGGLEDLADRPERDALAVGQAAALEDRRVVAQVATNSAVRRTLPTPAAPSRTSAPSCARPSPSRARRAAWPSSSSRP